MTTIQAALWRFNSRPHRGRRSLAPDQITMVSRFNSRPHRGRLFRPIHRTVCKCFNSRPHRGRRHSGHNRASQLIVSTHALTEGDLAFLSRILTTVAFQLTPSQRATTLCQAFRQSPVFQLTPSQRATTRHRLFPIPAVFQLTPSQRATCRCDHL